MQRFYATILPLNKIQCDEVKKENEKSVWKALKDLSRIGRCSISILLIFMGGGTTALSAENIGTNLELCSGDFNSDHWVGFSDYLSFGQFVINAEQAADLNFDGRINHKDVFQLLSSTGNCTPCVNGVSPDHPDCIKPAHWRYQSVCREYGCKAVADPMPNQIVVDPRDSRWLAYADGRAFYLAGAGDPEDFLYRGKRNADGTRAGDQIELIEKLARGGANGMYFQIVRTHGGDDKKEGNHNPFVDGVPEKGLDFDILEQWEQWFTMMDRKRIVMFLFFYDDDARIWRQDKSGLSREEIDFIRAIVERYKHHTHLVWVIAEEYEEAFNVAEVSEFAAHIRAVDNRRHPIAVHKTQDKGFYEFYDDESIDQYAMQISDLEPRGYNDAVNLEWRRSSAAARPYNINLAEAHGDWTGDSGRLKAWATALGGAYVMIYRMDIASTPMGDIEMLGNLRRFMESLPFTKMEPVNAMATGSTEYVMGDVEGGAGFILYTSQVGELGINFLQAGSYLLNWFDPVTGSRFTTRSVLERGGQQVFARPDGIGSEVALYLHQIAQSAK